MVGRADAAVDCLARGWRVTQSGPPRGFFDDHVKVPARQGDRRPRGQTWVHSVFRTLRGVIFVILWRAKRHFTLPYGA